MSGNAYLVTRGVGAPPRRGGREWAEGETLAEDLSAETLVALEADPRYAVVQIDQPKTPARRAKAASD